MKKYVLKGNKVYFDDFFYLSLGKQSILEFNLQKKDEVTDEEYSQLINISATSYGYYLLSKRDYSEKEFFQKLLLRYKEKSIISEVVEKFKNNGYLNDYDFAKFYIDTHSYSKKKMEYKLFEKGIKREVVNELLTSNRDKELDEIKRQWKKLGNKDNVKKINSLIRKGFEYKDIKKVIQGIEILEEEW